MDVLLGLLLIKLLGFKSLMIWNYKFSFEKVLHKACVLCICFNKLCNQTAPSNIFVSKIDALSYTPIPRNHRPTSMLQLLKKLFPIFRSSKQTSFKTKSKLTSENWSNLRYFYFTRFILERKDRFWWSRCGKLQVKSYRISFYRRLVY